MNLRSFSELSKVKKLNNKIPKINLELLIGIFVAILTFLIFFNRSELLGIKITVLCILFFLNLVKYKKKIIEQYDRRIILWVIAYVLLKLFFMLLGEANGGQAFVYYWKVYLFEPILYTVILLPSINAIKEEYVDRSLWCSLIGIIALLLCSYVFLKLEISTDFLIMLPCTLDINMDGNYIYISSMCIVSLIYLVPYFINEVIFEKNKKKRIFITGILITSILVMLIVGRRALILVSGIAVVLSLFLKYKICALEINKKKIINFFKIVALLLVVVSIFWIFSGSELRLGSAGKGSLSTSDSIRGQQITSLLVAWQENPIIGSGYGINLEDHVRSDIQGMYELSYLAMLAQTGIVGTICYTLLIAYMIIKLYNYIIFNKEVKAGSILIGLCCFLVANATNPYIYSFDGMWVLFYPLALLNRFMLQGKGEK